MRSAILVARAVLACCTVLGIGSCARGLPEAVVNDNRTPGGELRDGVRHLRLETTLAAWRNDEAVDTAMTVLAFAEADGRPRIPGPLVRVAVGDSVHLIIAHSAGDSALMLHGFGDSVRVARGETREVLFVATEPGTFLYWATTEGKAITTRAQRDAQLTGALIVDPPGVTPDTSERIFVITTIDILPDTASTPPKLDDLFEPAINGRSWPSTERLAYAVGDTVRWRWINGSYLPHPMHLHGFHFRRTAKGDGRTERIESEPQEVVTEHMLSGSTMRMEFVPTRAGNWLFHCHMAAHMSPWPPRPDSVRSHDVHDAEAHLRTSMSGLVMGIAVRGDSVVDPKPVARRLRLLAQEAKADSGRKPPRGFVLQQDAEPRADSIEIPGTPLLLTRGERVAITVVNHLPQHTTVHWHGMELESYFDGVSGWGGYPADSRRSPLVAPGDSFAVAFTPPRAGTFMYHTHMEEEPQLPFGTYGPMIVLEPGERFDPSRDLIFTIGNREDDGSQFPVINGRRTWDRPLEMRAGQDYRLRIIDIMPEIPIIVTLRAAGDTVPLTWTPRAKDGADLAAARRTPRPSRLLSGVGETWDFTWTPPRAMRAEIHLRSAGPEPGEVILPIRVR